VRIEHPREGWVDIPDDWMSGVDVESIRLRDHYLPLGSTPMLIALADIAPIDLSGRASLAPIGLDRDRFVSVLRAFSQGVPLPPLPVARDPHGDFRYQLRDGAHRFYASLAVGFAKAPAIEAWQHESDPLHPDNVRKE